MSVINLKNLVKEIKKAAKDQLHWQQTEDAHFVTNGHWLVKLQGQAFTAVRPTLLEVFKGREPDVLQTLTLRYKEVTVTTVAVSHIHRPTQAHLGTLTSLALLPSEVNKATLQFASFDGEIVAVKADHSALIANGPHPLYKPSKDALSPIYVGEDGDLMIQPVRPPDDSTWKHEITKLLI